MIMKGKTNIGIIFNLDPHYKQGSHWVAVFIKVRKKEIYYQRFSGLLNSIKGKSSWYRPKL